MSTNREKEWNAEVKESVDTLKTAKNWLKRMINHQQNDWESQKSAHHALKFLELAEYEMWNMQWWHNKGEQRLYHEAEDTIV